MIKDKIITLLDVMTDEQAEIILEYIRDTFELRQKNTWDNIGEDIPTSDEIEIINSYNEGDEDYKPTITHEQIKEEYNIKL
jgi:hypothetical protein